MVRAKIELDLEYIKKMYIKFKNTNEENMKNQVVTKLLEMLGYDSTDFYYEHSKYHKDGRADIAVKIDDVTYLYVEVKSPFSKLTDKDQNQLIQYLHDRGLSWGVLTNGRKYILLNDSIKPLPNFTRSINADKVVIQIDIFTTRHQELLYYLGKESIFDSKIIEYFKDIAQFKALKFPEGGGSWNQYKGTLINFFKYYANSQNRYRELNQIRLDEFEDFLLFELKKTKNRQSYKGKSINSIETFSNKYSHIREFFKTLKIRSHGFDLEKEQFLSRFNIMSKTINKKEILNDENIKLILKHFDKSNEAIRNKCILLLCLCFGFERSTLHSLTYNSIKKDKLVIENRVLVIPPQLLNLLAELKEHNRKNNVTGNHLFYSKHNKTYSPIKEGQINYVFDSIGKIEKHDDYWGQLNPTFIRKHLIKQFFINNYSIEEIVYITGTDLMNIQKLISYDEIIEQVKSRGKKDIKVHPFEKFLF